MHASITILVAALAGLGLAAPWSKADFRAPVATGNDYFYDQGNRGDTWGNGQRQEAEWDNYPGDNQWDDGENDESFSFCSRNPRACGLIVD
ncbi:hypothetical protein RJ55_04783 [Drechmeria coniospora]|nr:hypothetical protein RJ55_04783 [Drechmeria coniospora]